MRITIEDLEALKELNDELEENHAETEKQLHEDLGMIGFCFFCLIALTSSPLLEAKESRIREHARKVEILEDTVQDLEGTINQFRELVVQLQK